MLHVPGWLGSCTPGLYINKTIRVCSKTSGVALGAFLLAICVQKCVVVPATQTVVAREVVQVRSCRVRASGGTTRLTACARGDQCVHHAKRGDMRPSQLCEPRMLTKQLLHQCRDPDPHLCTPSSLPDLEGCTAVVCAAGRAGAPGPRDSCGRSNEVGGGRRSCSTSFNTECPWAQGLHAGAGYRHAHVQSKHQERTHLYMCHMYEKYDSYSVREPLASNAHFFMPSIRSLYPRTCTLGSRECMWTRWRR